MPSRSVAQTAGSLAWMLMRRMVSRLNQCSECTLRCVRGTDACAGLALRQAAQVGFMPPISAGCRGLCCAAALFALARWLQIVWCAWSAWSESVPHVCKRWCLTTRREEKAYGRVERSATAAAPAWALPWRETAARAQNLATGRHNRNCAFLNGVPRVS